MGYYTYYELTVVDPPRDMEELAARIEEYLSNRCENCFYGEAKWYDHDDDMLKISVEFPEVLFSLHGDGDEAEDLWYTYYKNGAMHHDPGRIVYEGYDEKSMEQTIPPAIVSNAELVSVDDISDMC